MGETKGRDFEHLVYFINKLLHQKYIITANEKIKDKDTGRVRQIDISIRTNDGPTEFLGIIEARCRNRPVTVDYIEQISEKARSVRANSAYIISSSGFADSALEKAKRLGIGTLSYKEAFDVDWQGVLGGLRTTFCTRRYDRVFLFNMDRKFDRIINPHPSIRKAVIEDIDAHVLVDHHHSPVYSIARLAYDLITSSSDELYKGILPNQPAQQRAKRFRLKTEPRLFILSEDEKYHEVEFVLLVADFFFEEVLLPSRLYTYGDSARDAVFAEVASSHFEHDGVRYRQEFIASHVKDGEEIPVFIRITKIKKSPTKKSSGRGISGA